jgi:hypothetical protein
MLFQLDPENRKYYGHVRSAGRPSPSCSALVPERRGAGEMWREVTFGLVDCGRVGTSSPYLDGQRKDGEIGG